VCVCVWGGGLQNSDFVLKIHDQLGSYYLPPSHTSIYLKVVTGDILKIYCDSKFKFIH
jgi:hypothetical protein